MTVVEARSLLRGDDDPRDGRFEPILVATNPAREIRALRRLGVRCLAWTPIVAIDGERRILLDIRGCERWLARRGGEPGLLDRIDSVLARLGMTARLAIADTVVAARAWATRPPDPRTATPPRDRRILPPGIDWTMLDPLPVECLELDHEIVDRLHQVNVRRVGELRRLPRTALPARYGPAVHHRLDQMAGRGGDAFLEAGVTAVVAPERILVRRDFTGPVRSRESIEMAMVDLVGTLHERLRQAAAGVRVARLAVERVDAPEWVDQVELSRATRRPSHLWAVLEPLVDRLPLDVGIDAITLEAVRHRRLHDRTNPIIPGAMAGMTDDRRDESVAALIDLVQARFGMESVRRFHPLPGHAPEDRMRMVPLDRTREADGDETIAESLSRAVRSSGPRPTTWLDHPEPIDVETHRGRPRRLEWRGGLRDVVEATGPEPIGAPWWRTPVTEEDPDGTPTPRRAYWCVRFESGLAAWIFHASSKDRWYVQGVWS